MYNKREFDYIVDLENFCGMGPVRRSIVFNVDSATKTNENAVKALTRILLQVWRIREMFLRLRISEGVKKLDVLVMSFSSRENV